MYCLPGLLIWRLLGRAKWLDLWPLGWKCLVDNTHFFFISLLRGMTRSSSCPWCGYESVQKAVSVCLSLLGEMFGISNSSRKERVVSAGETAGAERSIGVSSWRGVIGDALRYAVVCLSSLTVQCFNYCLCILRHFCFFCCPCGSTECRSIEYRHGLGEVSVFSQYSISSSLGLIWVCKGPALERDELNRSIVMLLQPTLFAVQVFQQLPGIARFFAIFHW